MVSYLLFFIYLVLFCWLLTKIKIIRNCGIDQRIIIALFLVRIAAGLINGYINFYYYPGTDTASFHHDGIVEYHLLFNNPKEYFIDLFKYNHNYSALLDAKNSFWNNLRSDLIIKLLSVFDIFSGGRFFINILFYNFLIFFGSIFLYKIFITIFPLKQKLLILSLFLLPSFIYFTSGIHKDGLIFLGIAMASYYLYAAVKKGFSVKRLLFFIAGLLIIFLLRNFVFITIIPAIIAWMLAEKNKKFVLVTFAFVYLVFIIVFFNIGALHPKLDLPQYVSTRQIAFIQIAKESQSAININPLFPNFRSFFNNTLQALNHTLMRPYLTEKFTLLYIPVAIEIFIYELLFILFIFFRYKNLKFPPFIYYALFFSFSIFLMIGYTIPIIGALVRYRSIYFPLVIAPVICSIDWKRLRLK